jgi:hypothetical protein
MNTDKGVFGKANSIARLDCNSADFLLKHSTTAQVELRGVAKVLQSGKNAMEILDSMDL